MNHVYHSDLPILPVLFTHRFVAGLRTFPFLHFLAGLLADFRGDLLRHLPVSRLRTLPSGHAFLPGDFFPDLPFTTDPPDLPFTTDPPDLTSAFTYFHSSILKLLR